MAPDTLNAAPVDDIPAIVKSRVPEFVSATSCFPTPPTATSSKSIAASLAVSSVCTLMVDAHTVSTTGASPELVKIEI